MTIRKLLLPTLIAAALAVPTAFAQNAGAKDQEHAPDPAAAAAKADAAKAKADAAKADARKDGKQEAKPKSAKKDAKSGADQEQPDEPEEDGR